jgi:hypothetical protein
MRIRVRGSKVPDTDADADTPTPKERSALADELTEITTTSNLAAPTIAIAITSPQKCPNGHTGWGGFRIVSPDHDLGLDPILTHIALNDAEPPEVWTMRIRYRPSIRNIRVICEQRVLESVICGAEFEFELPELI